MLLTAKPAYQEGNAAEFEAQATLGPDRQWIKLPHGVPFEGTLTVFAEDGVTPVGTQPVSLKPGSVYRLQWK